MRNIYDFTLFTAQKKIWALLEIKLLQWWSKYTILASVREAEQVSGEWNSLQVWPLDLYSC